MSDQEFNRVLGYAGAAMDLLKRGNIPPYPQYFELLYTYSAGLNPALNSRLNALLRDGQNPDESLAETLYKEFLRNQDEGDRINSVSERMHARIEAVNDAIGSAMASASIYSGSLEAAQGNLDGEMGADAIRELTARLLDQTRLMQQTNRQLESQLESSRDDMATLQRDLDDVRRESLLDPLTQIANRKSFDEGLRKAIEEARSKGEPMTLIMLDIDHFKRFNDTYGHQTGDQVLRLMAMTLKSNIKGKDMAARFGGEEFAAILPSTDLKGAMIIAESIRKAIQAKELLKRSTSEKLGRITASFGVAQLSADDNAASLIGRADRCLYAGKRAGRNVCIGEVQLARLEQAKSQAAA